MYTKEIRRRTGLIAAVVVGMIVGMTVLPGTSSASRPATPMNIVDPENPDQYMAQVSEDGALQVSGQVSVAGTSAVQVTNFPAVQEVNGAVDVGNLPPVQEVNGTVDVETPRAGSFRSFGSGGFDDRWTKNFPVIDARFISVASDDELSVFFFRPGQHAASVIELGNNRQPTQTISLPLIVPIDRVAAVCWNEADECIFSVDIIGE